jgi:hypothetical protein
MNTPAPAKAVVVKPKVKQKPMGPGSLKGSPEARRFAALVLEVLGGLRTPTDAAKAVNVSLPRYYLLETRALQGLVTALEPLPKGRRRNTDSEIASLSKQLERSRQEATRNQSMLRAAQRAIGLPPPPAKDAKIKTASGKMRRPRKATVRALRAVEALRKGADEVPATVPLPPSVEVRP